VVGRYAARGDDAVDMRMMLQALSPGVQHAEEADFGAEVFRIGGVFDQGFGAGGGPLGSWPAGRASGQTPGAGC
jgi:hypothetical protein